MTTPKRTIEETVRDLVTKVLEIKSDALFPLALCDLIKAALEKAVLAEREACAKVADKYTPCDFNCHCEAKIATAIRNEKR